MKKIVTTIVSLALAGTMALGLAACDKTEGNKALLKAIDATLASQNHGMSMESGMDATFYYNGEPLAADTVITTEEGEITGADLLLKFGIITDKEAFSNPLHSVLQSTLLDCDYAGGKVSVKEEYNGEMESRYYEVDGTTLNMYYQDQEWNWSDFDNPIVTYVPACTSYTNFESNAQAKAFLKDGINQSLEGVSLETIMLSDVKGTGKDSSRKGTIKELYDLFEFDSSTGTYSVVVDASELGGEMYANCALDIVVYSGVVSSITMTVSGNDYIEGMLSAMPEGITAEVTMGGNTQYYNYGSTSVTIPADVKNVDAKHIYVHPILTSAEDWAKLFENYGATEFRINYGREEEVDGETAYIYTNICVDTEANVASVERMNYNTNELSFTYYKVADGKLLTYVAKLDYGWVSGYGEPTVTDINGDATAALIGVLPACAQDYYAGFSGGALKDQFSKFELSSANSYGATLKLNGKEVRVEVLYRYYDGEYSLDTLRIYYSGSEAFEVTPNAKGDLADTSPDNYQN